MASATKTEPFGTTPLPTCDANGKPVKVTFDPEKAMSIAQQPQTQQIAVYESPLNEECINNNLLDVNQHFCVYAVKNGLIRVLHRHSSLRALLRGHSKQQVTDIRFFLDGDVLGSVGHSAEKSTILIWRIFEQSEDIGCETLLEISTSSFTMEKIIWHLFNPNQFWMIHTTDNADADAKQMVATLVETTKIQTTAHPTDNHALCHIAPGECIMDGAVQISAPSSMAAGSSIKDLCFSGRDSRHVLTVHDSGDIVLWDLKELDNSRSNLTPSGASTVTPKMLTIIHQDAPQTRCFFLPHEFTIEQHPNGVPSDDAAITTCFVTAENNNTVMTIWSSFTERRMHPTKLQVISLENASPSYILDLCFGPAPQDASPPSCFLLAGDRHKGKLMAFHVRSMWNKGEGSQKKALCVGSDYVVPFTQHYPTYSWSVVCSPTTDISEEQLQEQAGLIFDMKLFGYQSKAIQCLTLTSYMCLPPENPWSEATVGVHVEPLSASGATVGASDFPEPPTTTPADLPQVTDIAANLAKLEFAEEYDVEDDDGVADDDDGDDEDSTNDIAAPDPNSLPPPDMSGTDMGYNAGMTGVNNPFANWLGAMAAQSSSTQPPPPGLVPAPADPAIVSTTPDAGIIPLAAQPQGLMPAPTPNDMRAPSVSSTTSSQQFLSPLDLLKGVAPMATPAPTPTPAPVTPSKKESKKSKKSDKSGSQANSSSSNNNNTKGRKGKNNNKSDSNAKSPFPDGKISILKPNRGDGANGSAKTAGQTVPTVPTAAPAVGTATTSQTMQTNVSQIAALPAVTAAAPGPSTSEIEDMMIRCLDVQFDKQQTFIVSQVKSAVKTEVENRVIPAMQKVVRDSLSSSVLRPIQSSVDKLSQAGVKVNKKDFAAAVASSAEEPVKHAMADSVRNVMVPALESIASQITAKVVESIPQPPPQDTQKLQDLTGQLTAMGDIIKKMSAEMQELKQTLATNQAAAAQTASARSLPVGQQAPPPAQHSKVNKLELLRKEIMQFLQQRNYETAFTKALSASTTDMTLFCCSRVNMSEVLCSPSPLLSPPILLCLMQQLGASLATSPKADFTIELNWLQELALAINPADPSIQKHVPGIMQQLIAHVDAKMAQNDPKLRRPLQRLLQMVRGMFLV